MLPALLLLFSRAAAAAPGDVRVRWQPSPTANVAGYRVHPRLAGGPWGASIEVGLPAPAADGSLAAVVTGFDAVDGWSFAVTAYLSDGRESVRSNEMALTQPGTTTTTSTSTSRPPITTTTSTSTSTTVPRSATSTTRPPAATTTSTTAPRPTTSTTSTTRPRVTTTSTTRPRPTSTSSTTTSTSTTETSIDPTTTTVTTSTTLPALCDGSVGGAPIAVDQLVLRGRTPRTSRLVARAAFVTPRTFDPSRTGLRLALYGRTVEPLWLGDLPGSVLLPRGRGASWTLVLWRGQPPPGAPGLRRLVLRRRKDRIVLVAVGRGPEFQRAAGAAAVALAVRLGEDCSATRPLDCTLDGGATRCQ